MNLTVDPKVHCLKIMNIGYIYHHHDMCTSVLFIKKPKFIFNRILYILLYMGLNIVRFPQIILTVGQMTS